MDKGQTAAGADPEGAIGTRTEGPKVMVRQVAVGRGEDLPDVLEAGQPTGVPTLGVPHW